MLDACEDGDWKRAVVLLERGAYVDYRHDRDGCTALYLACHDGDVDLVEVLLAYGAGVNEENNRGFNPLYAACFNAYPDIVKLLVEHGADVHTVNEYNQTPLHAACMTPELEIVRTLLDLGSNPMKMDDQRFTALNVALSAKYTPILELIRSYVIENCIFTHPLTDSVPNLNLFVTDKVGSASFLLYGVEHPLSKWEVREYMDVVGCVRNGVLVMARRYGLEVYEDPRQKGGLTAISHAYSPLPTHIQRTLLFWTHY